jgi:hypothetical protein
MKGTRTLFRWTSLEFLHLAVKALLNPFREPVSSYRL